ncbi:MAG: hypothetical protein Q8P67_16830 [archaeon]|nr:hypothetical protein [archaeon]
MCPPQITDIGSVSVEIQALDMAEIGAELSDFLNELERRFQDQLEENGRGEHGWAGRLHCAADGYLKRPLLYEKSWVFRAVLSSGEHRWHGGSYVVSQRQQWVGGRVQQHVFGYLARIPEEARSLGIGGRFFLHIHDFFSQDGQLGSGIVARDNHASLKMTMRSGSVVGMQFAGEMVEYALLRDAFPSITVPNASLRVLDTAEKADAVFERMFGNNSMRVADSGVVMRLPQHAGHFVLEATGSEAGVSLWRPDYSVMVTGDGRRVAYLLVYNMWTTGEGGELLLLDLVGRMLRHQGLEHAIALLTRSTPSQAVRPSPLPGLAVYAANPLERLIRPHAVGFEEELVRLSFTSFLHDGRTVDQYLPFPKIFYDPRDLSTLVIFHSMSEFPMMI